MMTAAGRRGLSTKAESPSAGLRKRRKPRVAKNMRKIVNGGGGAEIMRVLSLVSDRPVSGAAAQPLQHQSFQSAQAAAAAQRAAEAAAEMRGALQGFAREDMLKKLRRTRQEERVAKGKPKYWGV